MQKKADNKQNWMTADRSNGSVIGNAQIGTVSGTKVIGNAVIGGMAACCETDVELAAKGLSRQTGSGSTVIGKSRSCSRATAAAVSTARVRWLA